MEIYRCWGTTLNKDVLPLRLINTLTFTLSVLGHAMLKFRAEDTVLVVTNPPSLPLAVILACFVRRARCALIVHDVYPQALVATGILKANAPTTKIIQRMSDFLYRRARRIVVLGRDMAHLVQARLPKGDQRIVTIPHWPDADLVEPERRESNSLLSELGLTDKFVVQYFGNIGRTHGIGQIVDCAHHLKDHNDIHFLFMGAGAAKVPLEQRVDHLGLHNVTIEGRLPYAQLSTGLNACDVAIISFIKGMAGISVPSRMYNVMAAGKPIIAVADAESELAYVVTEERIGWVVPPGDVEALQQVIIEAAKHPAELVAMGQRARTVALSKYSRERAERAYAELVASMMAEED